MISSTRWVLIVVVFLGSLLAAANAYTDYAHLRRVSWWWLGSALVGMLWTVVYYVMTRRQ